MRQVNGQTANVWQLGYGVQVDFNFYPAKITTNDSIFYSSEGTASICDSNGRLLISSNGTRVWDSTGQTLVNGNNLLGSDNAIQSALFIEHSRANNSYFLFTNADVVSPSTTANVSLIETLNNSFQVTTKNSKLLDLPAEGFHAINKTNTDSIWIAFTEINSDSLWLYSIIGTTLRYSHKEKTNIPYTPDFFNSYPRLDPRKQLVFSPDGTRLAISAFGSKSVYVYDFNLVTGKLSSPKVINTQIAARIAFSPDSRFLYISCPYKIYQTPINQLNATNFIESLPVAITDSTQIFGSLQITPHESIFILSQNINGLYAQEIINPNDSSNLLRFNAKSELNKSGPMALYSVPNILGKYLLNSKSFQVSSCLGDSTLFHSAFVDEDSVWWVFGDGKRLFGPTTGIKHLYSSPGTYRYALIRPGKDTLFNYAEVLGTQNKILVQDTLLFSGDSLQLRFQGVSPDNWTWSDNSADSSLTVSQPGTYSIHAQLGACPIADTVQVHFVHRLPHQMLCLPDSLQMALSSSQADSLFIQNQVYSGTDSFEFKTSTSGSYALPISYFKNGLNAKDTLVLQATKVPVPYLGPDSLYCLNESLSISIDTAVYPAFRWENGDSLNASRTIQQSGTYNVQASVDQCTASDTLQVYFIDCRVYVEDTCLLDTAKLWLNLSDSFAVSWTSGSAQQSSIGSDSFFIPNTNSGNTAFTVMVKRGQASRELQGTYLTVARPELTTLDSLLCKNSLFFPYLDSLNYAFLWNTGSNHAAFIPDSSGWHWVSLSYLGCSYTDSFFLNLIECDCPVWVPNAFSPNNKDGLNDQFQAVTLCETEEFLLEIYNRWGQLVYRSANPNEAWDGKYQNIKCPSEYYLWRLSIRSKKGLNTEQKGYVFLLP